MKHVAISFDDANLLVGIVANTAQQWHNACKNHDSGQFPMDPERRRFAEGVMAQLAGLESRLMDAMKTCFDIGEPDDGHSD